MSDFADERVQRIASVTFNDEDGEGAVAEWWDMLASLDGDVIQLRKALLALAKYGDHTTDCAVRQATAPCNCGWLETLHTLGEP